MTQGRQDDLADVLYRHAGPPVEQGPDLAGEHERLGRPRARSEAEVLIHVGGREPAVGMGRQNEPDRVVLHARRDADASHESLLFDDRRRVERARAEVERFERARAVAQRGDERQRGASADGRVVKEAERPQRPPFSLRANRAQSPTRLAWYDS